VAVGLGDEDLAALTSDVHGRSVARSIGFRC
jgi:hypothetical protein